MKHFLMITLVFITTACTQINLKGNTPTRMYTDHIRSKIIEKIAKFQFCYIKEYKLQKTAKKHSKVTLYFDIEKNGKVKKVDIKEHKEKLPFRLSSCIKTTLKSITFNKHFNGAVEVKQPMNFFPQHIK